MSRHNASSVVPRMSSAALSGDSAEEASGDDNMSEEPRSAKGMVSDLY